MSRYLAQLARHTAAREQPPAGIALAPRAPTLVETLREDTISAPGSLPSGPQAAQSKDTPPATLPPPATPEAAAPLRFQFPAQRLAAVEPTSPPTRMESAPGHDSRPLLLETKPRIETDFRSRSLPPDPWRPALEEAVPSSEPQPLLRQQPHFAAVPGLPQPEPPASEPPHANRPFPPEQPVPGLRATHEHVQTAHGAQRSAPADLSSGPQPPYPPSAPPPPTSDPVVEVIIGKIDVTLAAEPPPPLRAIPQPNQRPLPQKPVPPQAAGRLARQYLDR